MDKPSYAEMASNFDRKTTKDYLLQYLDRLKESVEKGEIPGTAGYNIDRKPLGRFQSTDGKFQIREKVTFTMEWEVWRTDDH